MHCGPIFLLPEMKLILLSHGNYRLNKVRFMNQDLNTRPETLHAIEYLLEIKLNIFSMKLLFNFCLTIMYCFKVHHENGSLCYVK